MRYRCQHCGHETDGDGDKSTDNLVSQSVCAACAGMPRSGWCANSKRRRREEDKFALAAEEEGSNTPGTVLNMDAWRAARSAGATAAEATQAAVAGPHKDETAEEMPKTPPYVERQPNAWPPEHLRDA